MNAVLQRFELTGKVALVTGASRGLGKAIAIGLADAGADIVVTSRSLESCQEIAREIEARGRRALAVACDVGRWADSDRLVAQVIEHFGHCDVLVNNAGVIQKMTPLAQTSEEMFDRIYGINTK